MAKINYGKNKLLQLLQRSRVQLSRLQWNLVAELTLPLADLVSECVIPSSAFADEAFPYVHNHSVGSSASLCRLVSIC